MLAPTLPYVSQVLQSCTLLNWFQSVAYAIAWRESISGQVAGLWPNAATVLSDDGGHGLFQLTYSFPDEWDDPYRNALYAIVTFLEPAETYWAQVEQGDNLVRCIAAEYNAGRDLALKGHDEGDVDKYTTDNYAAAVLGFYHSILASGKPT